MVTIIEVISRPSGLNLFTPFSIIDPLSCALVVAEYLQETSRDKIHKLVYNAKFLLSKLGQARVW